MNGQYVSRWIVAIAILTLGTSTRADWPQWGGSPGRNNAPDGKNVPVEWNVGEFDYKTRDWKSESAENVLWVSKLGDQSYGSPVVAGGRIFCATNNSTGYVARYPSKVDLGCLLCFRQRDGKFGWQLSREKLKTDSGRTDDAYDWGHVGICCSPLVEGDRLWVVTNRGEVVCVDTDGFYDNENDGPAKDEPNENRDEADVVWLYDMMKELGVRQHNMCSCSVTAAGDLLLVITGNGRDDMEDAMEAPDAPSFIALDKHTGKLLWADATPGKNILHGQWGSPAAGILGGVPQAIFPGGDGWLYSFLAEKSDSVAGSATGKPKLLWKFDCSAKKAKWEAGGGGDRNNIIATPVICDGRVYITGGQDPEHGEGKSTVWCIDPTKRGDVSSELVFDKAGKPVPPRREQGCDESAGETIKPNPNSAVVWSYSGEDVNGDGKFEFEEKMHRTLGMPAIKDGILAIADIAGLFHCIDAKTGKMHWTHDMLAGMWGSPLIVDGKIYIADEDGDVAVFELSPKKKMLAENNVESSVYSAPVYCDGVLYISTRDQLIAIKADKP